VAAETAGAYAAACGFAQQAAVARETAALQADTRGLTERLFEGGRGTERDVQEAEVLLQQTNARVPTFEAERQAALYALAVLTGDPPANPDAAAARCAAVPSAKAAIPVGDGAALLARRPDVHAAERTLAADVARIGVATAALYPTVTLAGVVNLGGVKPADLGKSRSLTYSYGPLISWSIPLNGAARARVRESQAQAQGSLAAFDGTVLAALKETEQALVRLDGAVAREQALARAAAASERAADLSQIRFRAGSDNFLQLLQAQRDRANARGDLAQAQADRAQAQIALFKALGGGWEDAPAVVSHSLPTR
jgi:NodT family efflux transporter outer membrane factor (OMF) lipoprotein